MRIVFDLETHLIKPGLLMPKMVCMSYVLNDGTTGLLNRDDGLRQMKVWLNEKHDFVGHHCQYDWGVIAAEDPATFLPLIFRAYEEGRVHDTKIRQQLIDIGNGELKFHVAEEGEEDLDEGEKAQHILKTQYGLDALAWRLLRKRVAKAGTWRLRYALLDGIPIDRWPQDAKDYAIGDSIVTKEVLEEQNSRYPTKYFINSRKQHQAAWALHLMSAWGIRTDGSAVKTLDEKLDKELSIAYAKLRDAKLVKPGTNKRHMKSIRARVAEAYITLNEMPPLTPKGNELVIKAAGKPVDNILDYISTAADTLKAAAKANAKKPLPKLDDLTPLLDPNVFQQMMDDIPFIDLLVLAEGGKYGKLKTTYVPILQNGVRYPINASFNCLVESGRTSCARPNLQNPPRKGGVRECFVPRPRCVFVTCDYDTLELRTLAQATIAIGCSNRFMADALIRGEDLHLNLAADVLEIDREEAKRRYKAGDQEVEEYRQLCKIANFGFPGGMASKTFVDYCAGYGVIITQELSDKLHKAWKSTWKEMAEYFDYIKKSLQIDDPVNGIPTIQQLYSNRLRGDVTFTAAANSLFQGLAADGAKDALWEVTKECFLDKNSPLYGSHPVIFLHDEILIEVPEDKASAAAKRLAEIMINTMKRWVKDVPITATPVIFRKWFKGAKPVYNDNGDLVPCKPVVDGKKVKWVHDQGENECSTSTSAPTAATPGTSTTIAA